MLNVRRHRDECLFIRHRYQRVLGACGDSHRQGFRRVGRLHTRPNQTCFRPRLWPKSRFGKQTAVTRAQQKEPSGGLGVTTGPRGSTARVCPRVMTEVAPRRRPPLRLPLPDVRQPAAAEDDAPCHARRGGDVTPTCRARGVDHGFTSATGSSADGKLP